MNYILSNLNFDSIFWHLTAFPLTLSENENAIQFHSFGIRTPVNVMHLRIKMDSGVWQNLNSFNLRTVLSLKNIKILVL